MPLNTAKVFVALVRKCMGVLFAATLAAGAAAQSPINVSVDTTSHSYAIPTDFTGLSFERGTENYGNAGVSGYLFSPTDTQLITLFQNLGLRNLRVGGGSVDTEALVTNTVANDNLFQFAAKAGVKVIYTVRMLNTHNNFPNLIQQDAGIDAYIWQHYRPLVDNFAIGNEPDWHNPYHTAGDPAIYEIPGGGTGSAYPSYLTDWRNFESAIEAAAPGSKFSGPDTGAYTTFTYYNGESWTQHFAQDEVNDPLIADITQHYYVGGGPSTTTATQAIDNMLSPAWINNTEIGTQTTGAGDGKTTTYSPYPWLYNNNIAPVVALGMPYRLTEFNDYLTGINGASNGYAAALWALDAMHWWAEHGAAGVDFHNKQWINTDTIVPGPLPCVGTCGNFQTRAKGYGIKAFDMGSHGFVEPVTLTNPASVNLTAYAVGSARNLFVTVVNKTHTSTNDVTDAAVTISPAGLGAASCAALTLTDGTDGDASLMTASLGGAAITNNSRWQGQWTPLAPATDGHCTLTVQAASASVVKLLAAGAYQGPVQINQNGALEIFGTDSTGNVTHNWQTTSAIPQSALSAWQGWTSNLSGVTSSGGVAVVRNLDNTLEIFVPTASGDVQNNYQTTPGGAWNGWTDMGQGSTGITHLVAANNADSSLTVCGIGTNRDVWCSSENAPGVAWSAWTDLGGQQIQPGFVLGQDLSGRLQAIGVDASGRVWNNLQTAAGGWSGWTLLAANGSSAQPNSLGYGHMDSQLGVGRNLDGRLQVFGVGAGGTLWQIAQQAPGGPWGQWTPVDGLRVQPGFVVGQDSTGRLTIFGVPQSSTVLTSGTSSAPTPQNVWSIAQQTPGGPWGSAMNLGGTLTSSSLVVANTADGRLQLFGTGSNGNVWSNWQTGTTWSGWTDFGGNGIQF